MYKKQKQRVREKTETGFIAGATFANGPIDGQLLQNGCMRKYTETIDYDTGSAQNLCAAAKSIDVLGTPASTTSFGDWSGYVRCGQPPTVLCPEGIPPTLQPDDSRVIGFATLGSVVIPPDTRQLAQARFDAYQRLIYAVPRPHMNYGQAFCELKDTKQTLGPLMNLVKWGRRAAKRGTLILPGKSGKLVSKKLSLLSSAASIASAYLWYTFGVEPTVRDVKTFIRQLSEGRLTTQGKKERVIPKGSIMVQRFSARPKIESIGSAMFDGSQGSVSTGGGSSWQVSGEIRWPNYSNYYTVPAMWQLLGTWPAGRKVTVTEVQGALSAEVTKDIVIPADRDLATKMKWNCPLGASLWELTPFSFLVDWFIDVGQFIKNLDHKAMGVSYATELGAIWENSRTTSVTYIPALKSFTWQMDDPKPPTSWEYGGTFHANGMCAAAPVRGSSSTSFSRTMLSGPPPLPGLEIASEVKAYQISSGMALLVQFANSMLR